MVAFPCNRKHPPTLSFNRYGLSLSCKYFCLVKSSLSLWIIAGLAAAIAIIYSIVVLSPQGSGQPYYYGPYGMMRFAYFGPGYLMPIIGIFSFIIIIGLLYFIIESTSPGDGRSAENIARERLAKGEISEEEFRKIINNIRGRVV